MEKEKQGLEKEIQAILQGAARKHTSKKRRGKWIDTVEMEDGKLEQAIAAIARAAEADKCDALEVQDAMWKDIEAGHLATIAQMVDRIAKAKTEGWLIDTQQADTGHYRTVRLNQINGIIDEALSSAPRVLARLQLRAEHFMRGTEMDVASTDLGGLYVSRLDVPDGEFVTLTVTLDEGGEGG